MTTLPHLLYSAEQTHALDRIAIEQYAIPGIELMERAGLVAFKRLQIQWPQAREIALFCGGGNNGGDGFVIARLAEQTGLSVSLYLLADIKKLTGEAKLAFATLSNSVSIECLPLPDRLNDIDLIVDGLLGTGLQSEVRGDYTQAIELINQTPTPVLAIDLPSGLNADTGQVMGCAVQADVTISFIGLNRGLLTGQGTRYCGEIYFDDLSLPAEIYDKLSTHVTRVDYASLKHLIQPRPADAHKGNCGHLLLVGGDHGMSGAIHIAGEAALRCGSGLVTLATRAEHASLISAQRPELMSRGVESEEVLAPLLDSADVIVCGPGLGQNSWGRRMLAAVLATDKPLILDADGLNLLAKNPSHRASWLLTPHPAEAARLLDCTTAEVQVDRFYAITALQKRYGGYILLKGAGSLMCDPSGEISLCNDGNPGMASGGMGDLLSGILGSLLGQGIPHVQALPLAVVLHATAGDLAAGSAPRGLLASDLLYPLRELVNCNE